MGLVTPQPVGSLFPDQGLNRWTTRKVSGLYLLILCLSFSFPLACEVSEVAQSCLTLCYPVEYSPPGSSVYGIFQARILEWVAISFSRGSSQPRDQPSSPTLQADALTSEPPGILLKIVSCYKYLFAHIFIWALGGHCKFPHFPHFLDFQMYFRPILYRYLSFLSMFEDAKVEFKMTASIFHFFHC